MAEALLALGGNVGDARATCARALAMLCDGVGTRLIVRSSDYATPPWGIEEQPAFVNLCAAVATDLTPQALLASIHEVEKHLLLGAILVSLTIFLFLRDWRTMIMASISIPTSVIATMLPASSSVMGFSSVMTVNAQNQSSGPFSDKSLRSNGMADSPMPIIF